ncbi:MAG: ABC transporter permease [Desulfobacteraceae bacterium]
MTEKIAKRIFDKSDAVGEKLQLNRTHSMQVSAVIKDMPTNTHLLQIRIIAPNHANFSIAAEQDRNPVKGYFGAKLWRTNTYIKLPPKISLEPITDDLPAMLDRHLPLSEGQKNSEIYRLDVMLIKDIHLSSPDPDKDAVNLRGIYTSASIALLIILAATVNFVNLMTAKGTKRAPEVAIRKTAGANRVNIIHQFMTESFLYVISAGIVSIVLSHFLLEHYSAFLFRKIEFNLLTNYQFVISAFGALIVIGLLASIYPSLVLSSYLPVGLFKTAGTETGVGRVRQALSIIQFTILTGLIISAYVIYSQAQFGMKEAIGKIKDPVAIINTEYNSPLKQELLKVAGVKTVAGSGGIPQWGIGPGSGVSLKTNPKERNTGVRYMSVDTGYFELYDLKPAAGRFFSEERPGDLTPEDNVWNRPEAIVINETIARNLGFKTPQDAVGEFLVWRHVFKLPTVFTPPHDAQIIGVVENFQIGSVVHNIFPAVFFVHRSQFRMLSIRIDKKLMGETLNAIDDIWLKHIKTGPIQRYFFDDTVKGIYLGITRQAQILAIYSCVAIFISILGLISLAHFIAEKSTKEIGVRKVLGGSRAGIVSLLLWKFSNILAILFFSNNLLKW